MQKIETFKSIDPTKIRSPSLSNRNTANPMSLSSRGMKFLNLVRQNNLSPRNLSSIVNAQNKNNLETKTPEKNEKQPNKAYLTFSAPVPDPGASPKNSILSKRKLENSASPLTAKRKRVGFLDPVSTTKEYLRDDVEYQEPNTSSARCLVYDNEDEPEQMIESEIVIKTEIISMDEEIQENSTVESTTIEPEPEMTIEYLEPTVEIEEVNQNDLVFKNKSELLDYIKSNLTIDEVLEKLAQVEEPEAIKRKEILNKVTERVSFREMFEHYLFKGETRANPDLTRLTPSQNTLITGFINDVSKVMACNNVVKYKVLDTLSEKHPQEFLDHALQENSANKVCEKISVKNIINFLIHKTNVQECKEQEGLVNGLSKELILHLVSNTNQNGSQLNEEDIRTILLLLFKHRPKIDIFDILHDFLRSYL